MSWNWDRDGVLQFPTGSRKCASEKKDFLSKCEFCLYQMIWNQGREWMKETKKDTQAKSSNR